MGRYAVHRKDATEAEIVAALESVGASVAYLAGTDGLPDIAVAFRGVTHMIEIKTDEKAPLRPKQQDFIDRWQAPVHVVWSVDHALEVIGIKPGPRVTQRQINIRAQDAWLSPDDMEDDQGEPWGV